MVARPYQWWRVALVSVSGVAYVVIFAIPLAREKFMLDPSNLVVTATGMGIGLVAAALIEAIWVDSGPSARRTSDFVADGAYRARLTGAWPRRSNGKGRIMGFLDKAKEVITENVDKAKGRHHRRTSTRSAGHRQGR